MREIRKKHKVNDVACVIQVNALNQDGDEGVMTATVCFGDPLNKPVMLAQALGREQSNFTGTIAKYLKGK